MNYSNKRFGVFLSSVAILALLLAALTLYPFFHNNYIFPLGQLRQSISIGQPYDEVERMFDIYIEKHRDDTDLQFTKGETESHILKGKMPTTKQLFIYDLSMFDDVQLQVLFDQTDRVKEINFIGD
jgi:hypothetical protein